MWRRRLPWRWRLMRCLGSAPMGSLPSRGQRLAAGRHAMTIDDETSNPMERANAERLRWRALVVEQLGERGKALVASAGLARLGRGRPRAGGPTIGPHRQR